MAGTLVAVPAQGDPDNIVVVEETAAERPWLLSSMCLIVAVGLQVDEQRRRRRRQTNRSVASTDERDWVFGLSDWSHVPAIRETGETEDATWSRGGNRFFEDAGADDVLTRDAGPATDSANRVTADQEQIDVRSARKLYHSGRESDSSRIPRSKRPWWSALGTVALLLLAGLPWLTAQKHDQRGAALQPASVSAASRHGYVPIEQLRVGDRVLAENPEHSAGETASDTQVDPGTWRHLVLEADYRWPDGTPDPIRVETLQPPDWIAMQGAEVGQLVDLPLDLVEMGLPADLRARVLDNRSCPPLAPGPGRVVLTTVNHLHNRMLELQVRDAHGRPETLRPTCFHKFYSQTRRAWVSAQDLQVDEVLAGLRGAVTVVSTAALPGIHRVYNLTVEGEHVYHVSEQQVAAHNNGCSPPKRTPARGKPNSLEAFDDGRGGGTIRDFGPDGRARTDYDFGHDHGAGDPHAHDWELSALIAQRVRLLLRTSLSAPWNLVRSSVISTKYGSWRHRCLDVRFPAT